MPHQRCPEIPALARRIRTHKLGPHGSDGPEAWSPGRSAWESALDDAPPHGLSVHEHPWGEAYWRHFSCLSYTAGPCGHTPRHHFQGDPVPSPLDLDLVSLRMVWPPVTGAAWANLLVSFEEEMHPKEEGCSEEELTARLEET